MQGNRSTTYIGLGGVKHVPRMPRAQRSVARPSRDWIATCIAVTVLAIVGGAAQASGISQAANEVSASDAFSPVPIAATGTAKQSQFKTTDIGNPDFLEDLPPVLLQPAPEIAKYKKVIAQAPPDTVSHPGGTSSSTTPPVSQESESRAPTGISPGSMEAPSEKGSSSTPSGASQSSTATPPGMPQGSTEIAGKSSLGGKITDFAGAVINGAHVLLHLEGADHKRLEIDSDETGAYKFPSLEPGQWRMTVSAPEMLSHTQTIDIASGESKSIDVKLEDLEPEDLMRITGKRTLIHPEKIGSRTNVNHDVVYKYRSGNDLKQLIETTPGVVTDTLGNMIIRGEHNAANYVLDDVILPEAAGVLQQSNFVTPRSLQSFDVDIGGYQASDGGGPLGAVVRMKSLPITEKRSLTIGQQLGGPIAGNVYYNASGAASLDKNSIWNKVRFDSSGNFLGTSLGLAPPVRSFLHNGRCDINSLSKIEFKPTERDRIRLSVGLNNTWSQIPSSRLSHHAGVRQRLYDGQNFAILSWKHQFERFFDESNLHIINAFYNQNYRSRAVFDPDPVFNGEQPLVSIQPNANRFNYVFGAQGNIIKTFMNTHRLEAGFLSEYRPVKTSFNAYYWNNDPANPDVPYGAIISPFTGLPGGPNFVGNNPGNYRGSRYLQSAYFQDSWRPTTGILRRLTLDAGVRADVYHGVFGNTQRVAQTILGIPDAPPFLQQPFRTQRVTNAQASGRFGGAFVLTPSTVLRGSFSNLFMPPPVDVISTPPSIEDQVNGIFNGTVRPMQATRGCLADTSIEQQIGPRGMFRTNLYYKKLTNFGDSGVVGNSMLYNRLTLSALESYGVESRLELRPDRRGYGFNGFLSSTFQIALLRGSKGITGGIYEVEADPILERYPDHDRRQSVVCGLGYNSRKNWWVFADYKMMTGLQDLRDPAIYGPHPSRTPVLNVFGLNAGYRAPEKIAAKYRWMPDTFDLRLENLFNNRNATNLGSPFQGTRYLLPFRFLIGCSWHVGQQQFKLSQADPKQKQVSKPKMFQL